MFPTFPMNFPINLHLLRGCSSEPQAGYPTSCHQGAVVHQPLPGQIGHIPSQRLQDRILLSGGHEELRLAPRLLGDLSIEQLGKTFIKCISLYKTIVMKTNIP